MWAEVLDDKGTAGTFCAVNLCCPMRHVEAAHEVLRCMKMYSFEKDSWWLMDLGDMLGEQQWAWLQQELQMSTADVNVIVSSLQTFANHRQEK